jgi:C-terminal processing protease CtpA/Prc
MKRPLIYLLVLCAVGLTAWQTRADDKANNSQIERKVIALEKRIARLEAQLRRMESRLAALTGSTEKRREADAKRAAARRERERSTARSRATEARTREAERPASVRQREARTTREHRATAQRSRRPTQTRESQRTSETPAKKVWLGVALNEQALVVDVFEDSPAQKAGIQEGDVITEIDGRPVENAHTIIAVVSRKRPGDKIVVGLSRGDETVQVEAVAAEKPGG